jgi:hypothetical protein
MHVKDNLESIRSNVCSSQMADWWLKPPHFAELFNKRKWDEQVFGRALNSPWVSRQVLWNLRRLTIFFFFDSSSLTAQTRLLGREFLITLQMAVAFETNSVPLGRQNCVVAKLPNWPFGNRNRHSADRNVCEVQFWIGQIKFLCPIKWCLTGLNRCASWNWLKKWK